MLRRGTVCSSFDALEITKGTKEDYRKVKEARLGSDYRVVKVVASL